MAVSAEQGRMWGLKMGGNACRMSLGALRVWLGEWTCVYAGCDGVILLDLWTDKS